MPSQNRRPRPGDQSFGLLCIPVFPVSTPGEKCLVRACVAPTGDRYSSQAYFPERQPAIIPTEVVGSDSIPKAVDQIAPALGPSNSVLMGPPVLVVRCRFLALGHSYPEACSMIHVCFPKPIQVRCCPPTVEYRRKDRGGFGCRESVIAQHGRSSWGVCD